MTALVLRGDAAHLPLTDGSVDLIVTSPPYFGQRQYTDDGKPLEGQIGAEETPAEYIAALLRCTAEWERVLKRAGSIFVNLDDSHYSGKGAPGRTTTDPKNAGRNARRTTRSPLDYGLNVPRKSLLLLPERYRIGCADQLGLTIREVIEWSKVNEMPESANDRCRRSHEDIIHLVRQPRYFTAVDEIREPHQPQSLARTKRNRFAPDRSQEGIGSPNTLNPADACHPLGQLPGSVWEIPTAPLLIPERIAHARCCGVRKQGDCKGLAHFAAFPPALPYKIILGWSPSGICLECGDGRFPVSAQASREPNDRLAIATRARTATARGTHVGSTLGYPAATADRRITGYACACTPQHWEQRKRPDGTSRRVRVYDIDDWEPAPTRPAVVLDPFGGTGTSALVADVLGRTGITVDRSADYCRLARWRTRDPAERARALGVPKPPPVPEGQASLFDELEAS